MDWRYYNENESYLLFKIQLLTLWRKYGGVLMIILNKYNMVHGPYIVTEVMDHKAVKIYDPELAKSTTAFARNIYYAI